MELWLWNGMKQILAEQVKATKFLMKYSLLVQFQQWSALLSAEMIPILISSGSQFLTEFRVQSYPWDCCLFLIVEPKVDQYPQGCTFPALKD